jgi:hypothetical protein
MILIGECHQIAYDESDKGPMDAGRQNRLERYRTALGIL